MKKILNFLLPIIFLATLTQAGVVNVGSGTVSDNSLSPLKLKSDNSPYDEACLTFEGSDNNFQWQGCGSGGGGVSSVNGDVGPAVTLDLDDVLDGATRKAVYTDSVTSTAILNKTIIDNDIANGTIQSLQIAQGTITDNNLDSQNLATDEYCLTYEAGFGKFEWQTCGGGGGVTGPGSSTTNAIATFSDTSGTTLLSSPLRSSGSAGYSLLRFPEDAGTEEIMFQGTTYASINYSPEIMYIQAAGKSILFHGPTQSLRLNSLFLFFDDNTPIRWGSNSDGTTITGSDAAGTLYFDGAGGTDEMTVSNDTVTIDASNFVANNLPSDTGTTLILNGSNQIALDTSSARFKTQITDAPDYSERIGELRPVTYYREQRQYGAKQIGLIAEEVAKVYPELVAFDKEGKPFSVDYSHLSVILLQEVQKLRTELESMKGTK